MTTPPSKDRPSGTPPAGGSPAARPAGGSPSGTPPAAGSPAARPTGAVPAGSRPVGGQPSGAKPGSRPPAASPGGRKTAGGPPGDNRAIGSRPVGAAPSKSTGRVGRGPALRRPDQRRVSNRRPIAIAVGIGAAVLVLVGAFVLLNRPAPSAAASPAPSGAAVACPTSPPPPFSATDAATVTFQTAKGDITIAVKGDLAPNATANFVSLAACGFYDGVVFHRLVPGFVIQGGDGQYGRLPNVDAAKVGQGGPGYTISDDPVTTTYHRGTVAMARTSAPNSQGSQFFVVLSDSAAQALAAVNTYAIVGEVTGGMDAVDAIAAMPNSGSPNNAAKQPLPIIKATVARP